MVINKSKRLWMTLLSILIWSILITFKDLNPVEVATGITLLLSPYLAAESMRQSNL